MVHKYKILQTFPYSGILVLVNFFVYHDYWLLNKFFTRSDFFIICTIRQLSIRLPERKQLPTMEPLYGFRLSMVDHYINSSFFPTHLVLDSFDINLHF